MQKTAGRVSSTGLPRSALSCTCSFASDRIKEFAYSSTNPGNKLAQFQGTVAIWEWKIPPQALPVVLQAFQEHGASLAANTRLDTGYAQGHAPGDQHPVRQLC